MVTSPWVKLRLRSQVERTASVTPLLDPTSCGPPPLQMRGRIPVGSLIAQHLDRVRAGRLPSWIESCKEREDQCRQHDRRNLEWIRFRGQVRQYADGRIPEVLASNELN